MNVSSRAIPGALCVALSLLLLPLAGRDRPIYPDRGEHEEEEEESGVRPDKPGQALAFRALSLQDDTGSIPAGALIRARKHVDEMRAARRARRRAQGSRMMPGFAPAPESSSGSPVAPGFGAEQIDPLTGAATTDQTTEMSAMSAPLTRSGWTSLGPGNIGGRIRAILVHPTKPTTMFAGSVGGGIWKTTNGGASWAPLNDFMANLAVTSMVFNPVNPSVMYAATGEGYNNADAIRGAGIFKSADGGATWTQLASTANASFHYVLRTAISPDGRVLLAATTTGLFRSADGGATFTRTPGPAAADVDFHSKDSSRAIAGDRAGRAWHTSDGGLTWAQSALNLPACEEGSRRVEVDYAAGTPDVVYAVVDCDGGVVFRSVDGGVTFAAVSGTQSVTLLQNGQGWYDLALWVNPRDANDLIVGGVHLYRSSDGGATFTQVSSSYALHPDQHVIVEHPQFDNASNRVLYVGNDGGVYKVLDLATLTSANTAQYQELNNNLAVTQFYGASGNPVTGTIVGGTQDNGTLVYDPWGGSESWRAMFGGDGGFSAADPSDPNFFYGEYVYLQLHRSTNGGASSSFIYSGIDDASYSANFIAPFVLDPNEPRRMLAGGQSLWRSDDVKAPVPSWRRVKPAASTYISAIAVAQGNSNIVWVGHNNGDLFRTTNGTAATPTWTKVDPTGFPNRFVTRITIDPYDGNVVYVAFGGFVDRNIQRTDNGGVTWVDASGSGSTGLPFAPVRDVEIDPSDSNVIWAGTEVGIFTSADRGATWDVTQDGPANVSVDELFVLGDSLYAVTHGRGLFRHPLTEVVEPPPPAPAAVPAPWATRDIGSVGVPGAAAYSDGTFTVTGAGADVWGTADAFRFVYQPLAGDGDIVARVASVENVASWVKAGVMIRGGFEPGAAHAFMIVSAAKGLAFQRRTQPGGVTTHTSAGTGAAPVWVKLSRRGSRVTASVSADGKTWSTVGEDTIALGGTAYAGLAVSSHTTARAATSAFDHVAVSTAVAGLPEGWLGRDIGAVGTAGSGVESGGTFTIKGSGADVWGTADAFRFAYTTLAGDGSIVARVASVSGTEAWTKVGVMMRGSTSAGSAHAFAIVSAGKGVAFQRRTANGGTSLHTAGGAGTAPSWLKLTRSGTKVTAYVSSNGTTWTAVGSDTFALPSTVLVGLAVSSHDPARLATGTFDTVSVR